FVDQAKCKELALHQVGRGAQVVFPVAGQCGLGALDTARQKRVQGIGVDSDQGYLGKHIMSSALKKVDTAVLEVARQVQTDTFEGGRDLVFDVKNNGVGIGKLSALGKQFKGHLRGVEEKLAAGKVKGISDS